MENNKGFKMWTTTTFLYKRERTKWCGEEMQPRAPVAGCQKHVTHVTNDMRRNKTTSQYCKFRFAKLQLLKQQRSTRWHTVFATWVLSFSIGLQQTRLPLLEKRSSTSVKSSVLLMTHNMTSAYRACRQLLLYVGNALTQLFQLLLWINNLRCRLIKLFRGSLLTQKKTTFKLGAKTEIQQIYSLILPQVEPLCQIFQNAFGFQCELENLQVHFPAAELVSRFCCEFRRCDERESFSLLPTSPPF